jgi:Cu(I)/Ag(I) efflux system membrane fusion protein
MPIGERLSVSSSAVVPTGDKFIVFVDHGGGQLEPREIQVGVHSGDNYEVISGLNEGDRIVAGANFLIDAESRIQGVLKTWGSRQ